jgi:hypothetical protein
MPILLTNFIFLGSIQLFYEHFLFHVCDVRVPAVVLIQETKASVSEINVKIRVIPRGN